MLPKKIESESKFINCIQFIIQIWPRPVESVVVVNCSNSIIPIISSNSNDIIKGATICKDGDLTEDFEYLRAYVSS